MNSKTRIITGRVRHEIADKIERMSQEEGKSKSEIIERALEGKRYPKEVEQLIEEMEFMASFCDKKVEDFAREMREAIKAEKVTYNGRLRLKGELDTERFEEACLEKGIEAQKRLDEQTEWVRRIKNVG